MASELLLRDRVALGVDTFAELVVWRVSPPVAASRHGLKYRLALVVRGECRLRYDNERGEGDHVHEQGVEKPYTFTTAERLLADFWAAVDRELSR